MQLMKNLNLLIVALLLSGFVLAGESDAKDSVKSKSCKFCFIKTGCKDFVSHLTYFGKSSNPDYKYKKLHLAIGGAPFINPLSGQLQKVFIQNGYSGIASSQETIGTTDYASGNPYVYNEKDIQSHISIGYSFTKFLAFDVIFRNIPLVYVDGYIGKSPYDYAPPDLEEEAINASSTEYRAEILAVSYNLNNKKLIDLSVGFGMVHYNFSINSLMSINQYDTTSMQQIVGQTTINNSSKAWSEAVNLHSDVFFNKYFSLEIEGEQFFTVMIKVPEQQFSDGPLTNPNLFTRTINAHTLSYKNSAFSVGLAFHLI
jgi:hypothetical protein